MVKLNFFVRFNRKYNDLWLIRLFVFTIRLKSYTVVLGLFDRHMNTSVFRHMNTSVF
jgi:hypothetical protein